MNAPLGPMKDVLRLTRAGRLAEATALIRQGLTGRGSGNPNPGGEAHTSPALSLPAPSVDLAGTPSGTFGVDAHALGRTGAHPAKAQGAAASPRPGSFETRAVSNAAGRRRYKLYVPARAGEGPLPLLVMLHGCTQTPDDFAAGTRMNALADEMGFLVAYPEQPKSANVSRCWNWFQPGDQRRDAGEPSLIAAITREIMDGLPVAPGKVYVAGLSAGGAAAAIMGQAYPDLYAGVGVHSGLACGMARDVPSAFAAMRTGEANGRASVDSGHPVPTIVFQGSADRTVNPANAAHVLGQATRESRDPDEVRGRSDGGTAYVRRVFRDDAGRLVAEEWMLEGAGHAWSGGSAAGSYTDPRGPDASREMMRFFSELPSA